MTQYCISKPILPLLLVSITLFAAGPRLVRAADAAGAVEERLAKVRTELKSDDPVVRQKAIASLIHSDLSSKLLAEMRETLKDREGTVRSTAATAVGNQGAAAVPAIPQLAEQLKGDSVKEARETAARALGRIGKAAPGEAAALRQPLSAASHDDTNPVTRVVAHGALAMLDVELAEQLAALRKYLHHDEALVREKAAHALGMIGLPAKAAAPEIVEVLARETDSHRRGYLARALGNTGDPASLPALRTALEKETDPGAQGEMRGAIARLTALPAEIRHSFFIAGPSFTGIIGEDGQEQWDAGRPAARDGYVLPNGNVLIAWTDEVKEFTRDKQVVFHYAKSAENAEIGTVERLENGFTLITELGKQPRLLEVTANGKIAVEFPLQPETDNAHMQTRMARKLPSGNYLVPHLLAFKVKEYTPQGKIVRELPTDLDELGGRASNSWPFTAILVPGGNTLVNLTHGNQVVELSAEGKVVWRVTNDDLPGRPFVDPCGAQRLPNGNTVIASYGATEGIKVLEITREKQIVWTYAGKHRAHEIQVLTTNGQPVTGKPLK